MQVKRTTHSETEVTLTIVTSTAEMVAMKNHVLEHFQQKVKLQGFREGKAPLNMVEKSVDQTELQSQFLEETINQLYPQVVNSEQIRPVDRPEITIKKFVPFTTLEFEAKVTVLGVIKLPDYKKIKVARPKVTITAKDVDGIIKSLQTQQAEKNDVDRAAKSGDQVWIDFKGTDAKGVPVKGADGKDYPLLIGSNAFIPGFEENMTGLKANDSKTFTLTFPKDYGVKALAGQKVTFEVSVTKVQEVVEPKADDDFAAKAGPFKSMKELRDDIKKQLSVERQRESDRNYESEIIRKITEKTMVTVPQVLVDDQVERILQDIRQNLSYRGQTFQEFLSSEGKTEEEYRKSIAPQAEERVKASLVLAEVAELEKVTITPEELDARMQSLKAQYPDTGMQAELKKPEARQDIASRMLSEKTVALLTKLASST